MDIKKRALRNLLFAAAFLFVALAAANAAAADNVLLDPGFEDNQPGQQPTFPPWWEWQDTSAAKTGTTTGEVTDKEFHSGKNSVTREVKGSAYGCFAQTIDIVPGQIVVGGVWIKTSKEFKNSEAYFRVEFKTADNTIIQAVESKRINSSDETWKLYTLGPSTAPNKAVMAVFGLFVIGKDKDAYAKAWFDDCYVYIKIKGLI